MKTKFNKNLKGGEFKLKNLSKLTYPLLFLAFIQANVAPAMAVSPRAEIRQEIGEDRRELKQETKQEKEDKKEIRTQAKAGRKFPASIIDGQVTSVSGSALTVTKSGKTFTVNTDSNTKFRRHFWGNGSLSDISVNDKVNVWGSFTDDAKTTIQATMIRDLSVMKRKGTFFGTVKSVSTSGFVITTLNRGDQTVTVSGTTKFVNRKEQTISLSDIKTGDKIRVKGMWDKANSTITEVAQIKDFTLPTK